MKRTFLFLFSTLALFSCSNQIAENQDILFTREDFQSQKLLSNGEVKLKGCKSAKTGRMYDAIVVMTVTEEGKPQFNMNFENGGKSK